MKAKKVVSLFLAVIMVLGILPSTFVFAQEDELSASEQTNIQQTEENLLVEEKPSQPAEAEETSTAEKAEECNVAITRPGVVYQGQNSYNLKFGFEFSKGIGEVYTEGEQIVLPTNIGELFQGEWEKYFHQLPIKDESQAVIAMVDISADKIVITIQGAGANHNYIAGEITTVSELLAKNVGATAEKDVVKTLQIGCATKEVIFKQRENRPSSSAGAVDIDTFWKNGWSSHLNEKGATISLEVNPIGSMDLYGSTTYRDSDGKLSRKPISHKTMLIEDPIPEKGFIDPASVQIWAAIPTIGVRDTDFKGNGWYDVPAGVYYAVRQGTLRWPLNAYNDNKRVRITQLEQNSGETLEQFRTRITEQQLQWGIYRDEVTKEETFLCNFGNVGKFEDGTPNNGILYSDYPERSYHTIYSEIFGENGASAGNIVSYYIEFDTYYPDVVGEKEVLNTAYFSSEAVGRFGRNASYTINNGNGTGIARKNELKLKLVDKADMKTPIADAEFKVQCWENDQWADTKVSGRTDENGNLTFGPFPVGKYRVVQLSTAEDYRFDNTTYGSSGASDKLLNSISQNGEFEVVKGNKYGFGSVVTNEKKPNYTVGFAFVAEDGTTQLPKEVMDQLPAPQAVKEGGTARLPAGLSLSEVKTEAGIWRFVAWDKTEIADVRSNVLFTGIWKLSKFAADLNAVPVIHATDKVLEVGDAFNALKDVTVEDKEDGNLTDRLEVIKNTVDASMAGVYEVTYKVTDNDGASTVKTIHVTVKDKEIVPGTSIPGKPETPDKPAAETPQTGDTSHMMLWMVLGVVSLSGVSCLLIVGRKKKSKN